MSDIDDAIFEEFREAFTVSADTDPLVYLRRAAPESRLALAHRIDAFLASAPRRPIEQLAADDPRIEATVDALMRSLVGHSGMWPSMLPRLRKRASIRRSELIERLADALGVPGKREKVGRYYHEMEVGVLPPDGVSDKVLDALASILGTSRERLREAGRELGEPTGAPAEIVFARTVTGEPVDDGASDARGPERPAAHDEVDALFRGGR